MNLSENPHNELLFVAFNQDSSCFACGSVDGFSVHNVHPFRETFRRVFTQGGIGIVEMLYRCNILALVGGGETPRYPPNKVMIWDDRQNRCVGELLFKTNVVAVRLRRDRVICVLDSKVHVHRFKDLKLLSQYVTYPNPNGLIAQSATQESDVLAVPGPNIGTVRIELNSIGKNTMLKAHESELAAIALNFDGSVLATASDKGTIVRTWDTVSGVQLREFRRGADRAEIYSIAFNRPSTYVICSSDKGTVHVFAHNGHNGFNTQASGGIGQYAQQHSAKPTVFENATLNGNGITATLSAPSTPPNTSTGHSNQTLAAMPGPLGYLQKVLPEAVVSVASVAAVDVAAVVAFALFLSFSLFL
jgi:WD repeat-containing protein 45